jgi:hypothetical protein
LFLFENQLDEPFHGGLSSNTLQNLVLYVIQSSENSLHLGFLLENFFRTFGRTFNYIVAGISVRAGGRLFSKIDAGKINWKEPCCLAVEDPQIPGQFLGENFFKSLEFRDQCRAASEEIAAAKPGRSVLMKIVRLPDRVVQGKEELARLYNALVAGNLAEIEPAKERRRRREKRPFNR